MNEDSESDFIGVNQVVCEARGDEEEPRRRLSDVCEADLFSAE